MTRRCNNSLRKPHAAVSLARAGLLCMAVGVWVSACVTDIDAGNSTVTGAAGVGGSGAGVAGMVAQAGTAGSPPIGGAGTPMVEGGTAGVPPSSDAGADGPLCVMPEPRLGDSCICIGKPSDGVQFDCDPVRNVGCDPFESCGFHRGSFQCLRPGPDKFTKGLCEPCRTEFDCQPTKGCSLAFDGICLKFCCEDADCGDQGRCDTEAFPHVGVLGYCVQR